MAAPFSSVFTTLTEGYTSRPDVAERMWTQMEHHYGSKSRHYHNLQHLQHLYEQLLLVKAAIDDWDTLLFALFYHDIIYRTTAKDNEEKSAAAEKALLQMAYPTAKIQRCKEHILATKTHVLSADADTNYFTDADLSILGAPWPQYEVYLRAIRKEYAIYPDLLYRPGRRKVLQHFLSMETIFKTAIFQYRLEAAARENLRQELLLLS